MFALQLDVQVEYGVILGARMIGCAARQLGHGQQESQHAHWFFFCWPPGRSRGPPISAPRNFTAHPGILQTASCLSVGVMGAWGLTCPNPCSNRIKAKHETRLGHGRLSVLPNGDRRLMHACQHDRLGDFGPLARQGAVSFRVCRFQLRPPKIGGPLTWRVQTGLGLSWSGPRHREELSRAGEKLTTPCGKP